MLGFSTSSSWHSTSTLPLVRLAFSVPAGRARTRPTTFRQNSLRTPFGGGEHRGPVGVADHLHQAFAVAQVDEDHAAVVAAAVGPAHQA